VRECVGNALTAIAHRGLHHQLILLDLQSQHVNQGHHMQTLPAGPVGSHLSSPVPSVEPSKAPSANPSSSAVITTLDSAVRRGSEGVFSMTLVDVSDVDLQSVLSRVYHSVTCSELDFCSTLYVACGFVSGYTRAQHVCGRLHVLS
jgi:hypothetical protein